MPEIMLDLETMGKGSNAAIIAIGAVEFNTEDKTLGREFYKVVDLQSSVDAGGVIDASTVLWWMKQSDAARAEFERPGWSIKKAITAFSLWATKFAPSEDICMWGNGAAFDNVILANAYERLGLTPPWGFRNNRCFRTVKAMNPLVHITETGTAHNALDDAKWQARYLMEVLGR